MKDYSYGNFICALREGAGLSQYQLGALVGVSDKAVSKWENGSTKPRANTMIRLAGVLGVSVDELLSCELNDNSPKRKESQTMKKELWNRAEELLIKKYGGDIRCRCRFESEKASMKNTDAILHFDILGRFISRARDEGVPAFTHGLLGNSLVAHLLGATDVDPLPPHRICGECGRLEFIEHGYGIWDLPAEKCSCGGDFLHDGHDLPFEALADSLGRGLSGFDVLVPKSRIDWARTTLCRDYSEYFSPAQIECMPPEEVAANMDVSSHKLMLLPKNSGMDESKGGLRKMSSQEYLTKFYNFPCVTILGLDMLDELMGCSRCAFDIPISPEAVRALFDQKAALLPGFDRCVEPSFSALLKLEGQLRGTGVWQGNGDDILRRHPERFYSLAAFREDVWDRVSAELDRLGIGDSGLAFAAMEDARMGRFARSPGNSCLAALRELGLPEWYIEHLSRILYLFPKAHAISHLLAELTLVSCKI